MVRLLVLNVSHKLSGVLLRRVQDLSSVETAWCSYKAVVLIKWLLGLVEIDSWLVEFQICKFLSVFLIGILLQVDIIRVVGCLIIIVGDTQSFIMHRAIEQLSTIWVASDYDSLMLTIIQICRTSSPILIIRIRVLILQSLKLGLPVDFLWAIRSVINRLISSIGIEFARFNHTTTSNIILEFNFLTSFSRMHQSVELNVLILMHLKLTHCKPARSILSLNLFLLERLFQQTGTSSLRVVNWVGRLEILVHPWVIYHLPIVNWCVNVCLRLLLLSLNIWLNWSRRASRNKIL